MKKSEKLPVREMSKDETDLFHLKKSIKYLWSGADEKRLANFQNQLFESCEGHLTDEIKLNTIQSFNLIKQMLCHRKDTEEKMFEMMEHYRIGIEYYRDTLSKQKEKHKNELDEAYTDCAIMKYTNSAHAIHKHPPYQNNFNPSLKIVR